MRLRQGLAKPTGMPPLGATTPSLPTRRKIIPFAESTGGARELRSIAQSHPTLLSRLPRRDW